LAITDLDYPHNLISWFYRIHFKLKFKLT
jgi:hypothetical protein